MKNGKSLQRVFRRLMQAAGALVAVLVVIVALLWLKSERLLARVHTVPTSAQLVFPTGRAALARGQHIAQTIGSCVLCHGADLGGRLFEDDGAIGVFAGPNLTRGKGGVANQLTDEDWIRAIRYGVHRDSTSLIVMPSEVFVHLSDSDLAALIAYLKQLPPVDRVVPETRFGPVGRALLAMGTLNLLVAPKTKPYISVPSVQPAATLEYGRYLAESSGCAGCHGFGLSGGRVAGPPTIPPASNITPAGRIANWSEADFVKAMRTGERPDGTRIDEFMPWKNLGRMTDEELHAIWLYLRSVPAKQFGTK
jgi:mono/diheme cytochrome c family protein